MAYMEAMSQTNVQGLVDQAAIVLPANASWDSSCECLNRLRG